MKRDSDMLPLLKMLQISDSMFPIGAFTLSDGLETFVYDKRLSTIEDLAEYVDSYLTVLSYNDLAIMHLAYELCPCREDGGIKLSNLDNLAFALKAPAEVREGSKKLCSRFIKLWNNLSQYKNLNEYNRLILDGMCYGVHAVAVGLYSRDIGLDYELAANIYTYQKLSAVVTNAVKTVPLSQVKGQAILNDSLRLIPDAVKLAKEIEDDELGLGGSMFDIESMRHEQQYSRLYMS